MTKQVTVEWQIECQHQDSQLYVPSKPPRTLEMALDKHNDQEYKYYDPKNKNKKNKNKNRN